MLITKHLKITLFFILIIPEILFSGTFSDGQIKKIDSLEKILATSSPKEKPDILNKLSKKYFSVSLDKSYDFAIKALEISKEFNNKADEALANYNLGNYFYTKSDFENSLDYFKRSLEIEEELGNKKNIAKVSNNIGIVYYDLGNFEKTLKYYLKSLRLEEELENTQGIAHCLNNIGIVYAAWGNKEKALDYYEKSLKLEEILGNKQGIAGSLNNIGIIYSDMGKDKLAIEYYEKALKLEQEFINIKGIAYALNNIGESYFELGEHKKALEYIQSSLEMEIEAGNKTGIAQSYTTIGKIYYRLGNNKKALDYNNKSFKIANSIKLNPTVLDNYDLYYKIYLSLGNYKKALNYHEKYNNLKDTIYNKKFHKQLAEIYAKFEIEKREREKEILRHENEIKEKELLNQRIYLIIIFVLMLVFGVMVYFDIKSKKKANIELKKKNQQITEQKEKSEKTFQELRISEQKLREVNATKDKFFSIIAHDLKNPFNAIIGFSNLLYEDFNKFNENEKKSFIKNIKDASESTFKLLQNLLDWSRTQTGKIEINPEIIDISTIVNDNISILKTNADTKNIKILSEVSFNTMAYADENMIKTVLRNLLSNAIKFTPKSGEVKIFADPFNNFIEVCISDTGIGISKENIENLFRIDKQFKTKGTVDEPGSGLGLILCKEFIEKNGGEIWAESELGKGSKFKFTLPVKV
ncbi:MAG: tetratricopeptide repeat-containing sensor histidine kinase [Bacteroidales bacterium]|nr:tetratricopeptide repeat-containing sensor histidine kinase [Bacteroidales bacterium]